MRRVHDCKLFPFFDVAFGYENQLAMLIVVAVPDSRIARVVEPRGDQENTRGGTGPESAT